MNKERLFLDFDGTIVDSIKAFCDTYNFYYEKIDGFKPADWSKVKQYNFKDQCPLVTDVQDIFSNIYFFDKLEFINCNTFEIIKELNKEFEIHIVTIGTINNIAQKSIWIKKNLPFIKHCEFLFNNGCKMDKSIVDMKDSIFIDDVLSNLESSNAKYKIIFGDEYEWNRDSEHIRCFNWSDVKALLIQ